MENIDWRFALFNESEVCAVSRVQDACFHAVHSRHTMTRAKVDTVLLLKEIRMMCGSPPLVVWAIKFRAETSKTAISL